MDKCRICLKDGSMVNIFLKRDSAMISTDIMSITRIQIYQEDGLPDKICKKCVTMLDNCLKFIDLCQNSDTQLRHLLLKNETKPVLNSEDVNEFKYDFGKFSPNSDTTKDLYIDETTTQTLLNDECETTIKEEKKKPKKLKKYKKHKKQCNVCGLVLSSSYSLKMHLRIHTGEQPFSCSFCNKTFASRHMLTVHLRRHTGEKPLTCLICNEKFSYSATLAIHKRKHMGNMPHACTLCPRRFATISHLKYHTSLHTNEKKYECETCNKPFATQSALNQHRIIHLEIKPHICNICGIRKTRMSGLRRHIERVHYGEKTFTCSNCPEKFTVRLDLEKHEKTHINLKDKVT